MRWDGHAALRAAAILLWVSAIGFGVFCPPAIMSLLRGSGVPYVMGFPAYGEGPFEGVGIPTTVPLLLVFFGVCVLEGVAGWLVWCASRAGAILANALLPVGAVFWWGFALPFGPLLALMRTVLLVVGWRSLR
ncbi:MAG: hypothetical protein U0X20_15825 [Caldilineaceae bacterium]